MKTQSKEFFAATRSQKILSCLMLFLASGFAGETVYAASVSVNPGSGPGNCLITATTSGFLPDPTGTNYANTGFYIDDGFWAHCEDMDGSSWANCNVTFRGPTTVGPHTIRASNSFGESATTSFTVNAPSLHAAPAFGPAGTHVTVDGETFVAAGNVGLYVDSGFFQNVVTDESGDFTTSITMPDLAPGFHDLVGIAGGANASAPFTITNCIGSVTVDTPGGTVTHPGGSPQPLQPGVPVPIQMGDVVKTGPGGNTPLSLIDGTQLTMAPNTTMQADNYIYDPNDSANNSVFFKTINGAFSYVGGLLEKNDNQNVQVNTIFGNLGIRGTQFLSRHDPCSATQEVYLIEGKLAITTLATPDVTNIYDAPLSIFLTASNVTTMPLTQTMYDSISNEVFVTNSILTFGSWLVHYFGCTNNNAAAALHADPDGDDQDNYAEFLAGTDPTSSASAFRILSAVTEGKDLRVTWNCGGGRTNVLQTTTNLGGSWTDLSTNILLAGSGDSPTNYLDPGAVTNATTRFYRVRLFP